MAIPNRRRLGRQLVLLAALAAGVPAMSAEHGHGGGDPGGVHMWRDMLARKQPLAAAVAFDAAGWLWRARVVDGHLVVDRSDDAGASFGEAVTVNPEREPIEDDGDGRPKIAVAGDGTLYVSYTHMLDQPYSGDIRFSRSLDGGRHFSPPVTVNDNHEVIGHRRDALLAGPGGRVYMVWLDKRDEAAAKRGGEAYAGSALYLAVSDDRGASFGANRKLADHACECCRIALAAGPDGVPAVFWRHIFPGSERDHAFLRLDGKSTPVRVSEDHWTIEACPHHGPAMSVGADGVYHLVWFDNAPQASGLFYARSTDGGKTFSTPLAFGNLAAQPGHADVVAQGRAVTVAWKEFDGERSTVQMMRSSDGGASWSAARAVAATAGASDHPQLAAHDGRVFLSWNTMQDGYRLIELGRAEP